ncbi:MAG: type II secretion system F family protein [Prevotellaceae bacterium]|nr:type II secretion system F family protein [Prevotellaceae bacterium]
MSISLNQLPNNGGKKNSKNVSTQSASKLRELLSKEITLGKKRYSEKKKEHFFSEMAMLLESGVDIRTTLDIMKQEHIKEKDVKLIDSIYNELVIGASLSKALEYAKLFDAYEVYSVRIGEETGQLIIVLKQIAEYYKTKVAFKRKLMSALSYPTVVLFTAILVVLFMLDFVVPMFTDIFRQSNVELPGITKGVMAISDFFHRYSLLFIFIAASLVSLYFYFRKNMSYRKFVSLSLLKLKYVGCIIRLTYLYRFCRTMVLHTGSGLPLMRTVQLMQKMIAYYPMEQDLAKIECDLLQGKSLADSMEDTILFDKKIISLTRMGEEVNKQEMVYTRMAAQYEQELQQKTELLSNILEPTILVIVGIFVAIILISMYLPMFKLGGAIG